MRFASLNPTPSSKPNVGLENCGGQNVLRPVWAMHLPQVAFVLEARLAFRFWGFESNQHATIVAEMVADQRGVLRRAIPFCGSSPGRPSSHRTEEAPLCGAQRVKDSREPPYGPNSYTEPWTYHSNDRCGVLSLRSSMPRIHRKRCE